MRSYIICTLHQTQFGDQIKEDEIDHQDMQNAQGEVHPNVVPHSLKKWKNFGEPNVNTDNGSKGIGCCSGQGPRWALTSTVINSLVP
jgi:hypothetical protein